MYNSYDFGSETLALGQLIIPCLIISQDKIPVYSRSPSTHPCMFLVFVFFHNPLVSNDPLQGGEWQCEGRVSQACNKMT